jgi:hypothetical protein
MITQFKAQLSDGAICVEGGLNKVTDVVMTKGVAVLRGGFDPTYVVKIRDAIMQWSQSTPAFPHGTAIQNVDQNLNYHRIDGDPAKSSAPHIHHHFNFNRIDRLSEPLKSRLFLIYDLMRVLQNRIAGTSAQFSPTGDKYKLRPQVIHYPAGGGFFAEHVHSLEPQRVGMILALSQRGADHVTGATTFAIGNIKIDSSPTHDCGDIILFRYDIPHAVTPVDPHKTINWNSSAGRWSMVLPYY